MQPYIEAYKEIFNNKYKMQNLWSSLCKEKHA